MFVILNVRQYWSLVTCVVTANYFTILVKCVVTNYFKFFSPRIYEGSDVIISKEIGLGHKTDVLAFIVYSKLSYILFST
jgi:hypothetical protein